MLTSTASRQDSSPGAPCPQRSLPAHGNQTPVGSSRRPRPLPRPVLTQAVLDRGQGRPPRTGLLDTVPTAMAAALRIYLQLDLSHVGRTMTIPWKASAISY